MKKAVNTIIICIALSTIAMGNTGCTTNPEQKSNNQKSKQMKTLVTYFSATGTTKAVAEKISKAANADLYEIRPEVPYTPADLDWNDKQSRSTIEMQDKNYRPALADKNAGIENYDTIYIGFPIWWYIAPTIINTFLESYDFSGKTIILFATSGGSGFGETVSNLQASCPPTTTIKEGKIFTARTTEADIEAWIKTLQN